MIICLLAFQNDLLSQFAEAHGLRQLSEGNRTGDKILCKAEIGIVRAIPDDDVIRK